MVLLLMPLLIVASLLASAGILWLLIRASSRTPDQMVLPAMYATSQSVPAQPELPGALAALDTVRERYARGEIDVDTVKQMTMQLLESGESTDQR